MQTSELRSFLSSSVQNSAVLTDYAVMEALKGNTLASVYKSLSILSEFPDQVVVLKTTYDVCGLHGQSRGLQRRLVDVPRTREFSIFCHALKSAQRGDSAMQGELMRVGTEATQHLDRMLVDAPSFASSGAEVAQSLTQDERRMLRSGQPYPRMFVGKIIDHVVQIAAVLFEQHPAVRRWPHPTELLNTYIFRSALCHFLLVLRWTSVGGVAGKAPAKLRNDMVDMHFAAYSTYFNGLLSNDRAASTLAEDASSILRRLQVA